VETLVSFLVDKTKIGRKAACGMIFLFCLIMGIPSSLGFGVWSSVSVANMSILDMCDFVSNSVLMPVVAFMTCVFIGWVMGTKTLEDEISITGNFKSKKLFRVVIKYVAPVCIVLILMSSILDVLGIMKI